MKKSLTKTWQEHDWRSAEAKLFSLQHRIHTASKSQDLPEVKRLQKRLLRSRHAKFLAVRHVAQDSNGRKSAGPDGIRNPSDAQKARMANELTVDHRPGAVRTKKIPKPGKKETRTLGIPNLADRAHQKLIALALEPEWEARFDRSIFGFRRGRSTHDALQAVQYGVKRAGKYAFDADIEKFFDRVDHDTLLTYVDSLPSIRLALQRILKTGYLLGGIYHDPLDKGTPQGGPISPLLANIVMSGLGPHLEQRFRQERREIGCKSYASPLLVSYADDLVVLHSERSVVEWAQTKIGDYLQPWGLNLHPGKSKIRHTLDPLEHGSAGFDFLGVHVQHHVGGKYAPRPFGQDLILLMTPSKDAEKRIRAKVSETVKSCKLTRKHRQARRDTLKKGKTDSVTLMIIRLNRVISGWAHYYTRYNSTRHRSALDNHVHQRLWQWAIRSFPKKKREWLIERVFSGVSRDKSGNALLRRDGGPRERSWIFKSPFVNNEDTKAITVKRTADLPALRPTKLKSDKSFYDGDSIYWATRLGHYPSCSPSFARWLKGQKGKCALCGERIEQLNGLVVGPLGGKSSKRGLYHADCLLQETCKQDHEPESVGT